MICKATIPCEAPHLLRERRRNVRQREIHCFVSTSFLFKQNKNNGNSSRKCTGLLRSFMDHRLPPFALISGTACFFGSGCIFGGAPALTSHTTTRPSHPAVATSDGLNSEKSRPVTNSEWCANRLTRGDTAPRNAAVPLFPLVVSHSMQFIS